MAALDDINTRQKHDAAAPTTGALKKLERLGRSVMSGKEMNQRSRATAIPTGPISE